MIERVTVNHKIYFEPLNRCICTKNTRIFLTNTEYMIFNYFIMNNNKIVYMDELLNYLYEEYNKSYTEQNIYVFILRIRKKIEDDYKDLKILLNTNPGYILITT